MQWGENNEQKIKGNGNTQIIVNGDYNTGLDKNEVITIIKSFWIVPHKTDSFFRIYWHDYKLEKFGVKALKNTLIYRF